MMIDGKHFDKSFVARLDTVFIRFTVTTVSGYQYYNNIGRVRKCACKICV